MSYAPTADIARALEAHVDAAAAGADVQTMRELRAALAALEDYPLGRVVEAVETTEDGASPLASYGSSSSGGASHAAVRPRDSNNSSSDDAVPPGGGTTDVLAAAA
jgi:hypothetical protein